MFSLGLERRIEPFIWVTWIPPLLSGDTNCEFMLHQLANYVAPKRNDGVAPEWIDEHNRLVSKVADEYQRIGRTVRIMDENRIEIQSRTGIRVVGKPDIIVEEVLRGPSKSRAVIVDAKTGRPRSKDRLQVMLYMMMSKAARSISGVTDMPDGQVRYGDDSVLDISQEEITEDFRQSVVRLLEMARTERVPDQRASGFCRLCKLNQICPSAQHHGTATNDTTDEF